MDSVLLVFAKVPRPGEVKTRLTPFLSPPDAAQLYEAFLGDALELYDRLAADVRLYLAPPLPEQDLDVVPDGMPVHEQRGDGLGPRMQRAVREAFEAGYERAAVVGTDHPTLPLAFIQKAFAVLDGDRCVCIGPTEDGGFYLLGMSTLYPQLFEGMSYSHDDVFADTLDRVERTDARLTILPRWYDVDTPDALERLVTDLQGADVEAPRTRRALQALDLSARSVAR